MNARGPALTIFRFEQTDFATYGRLEDAEHRQLAVTLELPWRNNMPNVSCIPAGTYTAVRYHSPKHGYDLFMITGVPHRSAIEMHIGNLPPDTDGCVLLGSNIGTVDGHHGITGSQAAFARFMDRMRGIDAFPLTIIDPDPGVTP